MVEGLGSFQWAHRLGCVRPLLIRSTIDKVNAFSCLFFFSFCPLGTYVPRLVISLLRIHTFSSFSSFCGSQCLLGKAKCRLLLRVFLHTFWCFWLTRWSSLLCNLSVGVYYRKRWLGWSVGYMYHTRGRKQKEGLPTVGSPYSFYGTFISNRALTEQVGESVSHICAVNCPTTLTLLQSTHFLLNTDTCLDV